MRTVRKVTIISLFLGICWMTAQAQSVGTITQLFGFSCAQTGACTSGDSPTGALAQGSDGNFYGTTVLGGTGTGGTVFRITPAGTLTTLFTFAMDQNGKFSNGEQPAAGLVEGKDGNLYGATLLGGTNNAGVIFRISKSGVGFKVLHSFCSSSACGDGMTPFAPLALGNDGNFYGTTGAGGSTNSGTIFRITAAGLFTLLHTLNGTTDGAAPHGGLVEASDGNFYGSTNTGLDNLEADLFRISPRGQYTVLTQLPFPGNVQGQLVQASDGNLYGTVQYGFVFRSDLAGSNVVMIHDLTVNEIGSGGVAAGFIQASDGNLWGTSVGQAFGPDFGVVYSLSTSGTFRGSTAFTCGNGGLVQANVVQGGDGNLYGTASECGTGANGNQAFGTVYTVQAGLTAPLPVIATFTPSQGSIGTKVLIRGDHLVGTTSISFNGAMATFRILDAEFLTATVPAGATSGPISVTNAGGAGISTANFTVQ